MPQLPVYIVDTCDHFRDSTAAMLTARGHAVQGFDSADAFLAQVAEPDGVLLLDVRLRGRSGLALQAMVAARPALTIVFASGGAEVTDALAAMKAGAMDFLVKPVPPRTLVRTVEQGLSRAAAAARVATARANRRAFESLSPAERTLVPRGMRSKVIAQRLSKAESTVKNQRVSVLRKMAARSCFDLASKMEDIAGLPPHGLAA
jgi:FixJ family two-component response regulator